MTLQPTPHCVPTFACLLAHMISPIYKGYVDLEFLNLVNMKCVVLQTLGTGTDSERVMTT